MWPLIRTTPPTPQPEADPQPTIWRHAYFHRVWLCPPPPNQATPFRVTDHDWSADGTKQTIRAWEPIAE